MCQVHVHRSEEYDERVLLHPKLIVSNPSSLSSTVKRCSFREEPEIISIQTASSLVDDPEELWFSEDDYHEFRFKSQRILDGTDDRGCRDGKKYCTRGLETYTALAQYYRRRIRSAILLSLEVDPSGNPTGFSEDRVEDALQLGINDAMTAFSMYFVNGGHRGPTGVKQCHAVSINPRVVFRRI